VKIAYNGSGFDSWVGQRNYI